MAEDRSIDSSDIQRDYIAYKRNLSKFEYELKNTNHVKGFSRSVAAK